MKAFILAAGIGSRLGEITKNTPKSLVDVNGHPILYYVIQRLKTAGVTDILINLHHLPEQVVSYIHANKGFDLNISFSYEASLLDTGGGLSKVRDFFDHKEPFFVHNSDIYCELDLAGLYRTHIENNHDVTLAVMTRESKRGLYFDDQMQLIGWTEEHLKAQSPGSLRFGFCGIHVVSPSLFEFMERFPASFSILQSQLSAARAGKKVRGLDIGETYWLDMGTEEKLKLLRERLVSK